MTTKISQKQLKANRLNAQLSTGPVTFEGKNKVKWNALKHGLLAKSVVIPTGDPFENRAEFESLLAQLHEQLKPVGILEEMLVEKIAVAYWRLGRAVRAEVGEIRERLLDWNELEAEEWGRDRGQGKHDIQMSRLALPSRYASDKIVRYETAIDRRLNKAIDQLERLQRRRQRDSTLLPDRTAAGSE